MQCSTQLKLWILKQRKSLRERNRSNRGEEETESKRGRGRPAGEPLERTDWEGFGRDCLR
uniref:Uncharacterized protein n=1 Tax=Rhizophora mucronata TaxID=61149 RepID=A0A2P2PKU3_RHIMU